MAKVVSQIFCQSSFPPLKNNSTTLPTLLLPLLNARPFFLHQFVPPTPTWTTKGTTIMSPMEIPTRKTHQILLQLDTSKSKDPDGIPTIVLKTWAPELALFLTNYYSFPTLLAHFPPRGNKPTSFLSL